GDEPGLAAYYRLDEGTGTTSADAAGQQPLTLSGGAFWISSGVSLTTGVARGALQLAGSAYASARGVITSLVDEITLEAWLRCDGGDFDQAVLYNGDAQTGYGLYVNPVRGVSIRVNGVDAADCPTCAVPSGEWTHLAAVRHAGQWTLY